MYFNMHTELGKISPIVHDTVKLPGLIIYTLDIFGLYLLLLETARLWQKKKKEKKRKKCQYDPVKTYFIILQEPRKHTQFLPESKANTANLNPTLTAAIQYS